MPYVRDSFWRGRTWAARPSNADRRGGVVRRGRRAPPPPLPGRRRPVVGVRGGGAAERCGRCRVTAFELARWSTPKVGPDCHVKVGQALYSVPWRLIGRHVDARDGDRTVEVFVDGAAGQDPPRVERGRQTDYGDYPPEKVAFFMRTPGWCRRRAAELGPARGRTDRRLLEINALHRLRSAQGVVGLADTHGAARARRRLPPGDRGRRPELSHRQGHPRRRHRTRPANPPSPRRPRPRTSTARRACSTPRRGRRMSPNARTLTPPRGRDRRSQATQTPGFGPVPPQRRR